MTEMMPPVPSVGDGNFAKKWEHVKNALRTVRNTRDDPADPDTTYAAVAGVASVDANVIDTIGALVRAYKNRGCPKSAAVDAAVYIMSSARNRALERVRDALRKVSQWDAHQSLVDARAPCGAVVVRGGGSMLPPVPTLDDAAFADKFKAVREAAWVLEGDHTVDVAPESLCETIVSLTVLLRQVRDVYFLALRVAESHVHHALSDPGAVATARAAGEMLAGDVGSAMAIVYDADAKGMNLLRTTLAPSAARIASG
jgi:hypothetical protein